DGRECCGQPIWSARGKTACDKHGAIRQRGRGETLLSGDELARLRKPAAGRIVYFGRAQRRMVAMGPLVIAVPTGHEYLAVLQQRHNRSEPRPFHRTGKAPGSRRGIVELGAGRKDAVVYVVRPADNQHFVTLKANGLMAGAPLPHGAGLAPAAGCRIVQLCATEIVGAKAPRDQYLAILQKSSSVAEARCGHA